MKNQAFMATGRALGQSKKSYTTPRLTVHGTVRQLTAGKDCPNGHDQPFGASGQGVCH